MLRAGDVALVALVRLPHVQQVDGVYYNVDSEGAVDEISEAEPARSTAAMMVPVKHEGRVVGVVQVMTDDGVESIALPAEGRVTIGREASCDVVIDRATVSLTQLDGDAAGAVDALARALLA